MEGVEEEEGGYNPAAEFQEDSREPLLDLTLTDSSELWLFQWPHNQVPDFDGREVSLSLRHDGCLGSLEGSSGKVYDVVNCVAQGQDPMVFLSSASGTNIVGKISRRVSLVHYPEPEELEKQEAEKKLKRLHHLSAGSSMISTSTPTQSTKLRSSHSSRGNTASTHSSRYKSSLSEVGEQSHRKRKHSHKTTGSTDRSTLESGRGHSARTISES